MGMVQKEGRRQPLFHNLFFLFRLLFEAFFKDFVTSSTFSKSLLHYHKKRKSSEALGSYDVAPLEVKDIRQIWRTDVRHTYVAF